MKKQKCQKCGAKSSNLQFAFHQNFVCGSQNHRGTYHQSDFCHSRCQVAKLKKQVERLRNRAEVAEAIIAAMRKGTRINAADHAAAQLRKPIF